MLPSGGPGQKLRNIRRMLTISCPLDRTAHGEPDKRNDSSGAAFEVASQTAGASGRDCDICNRFLGVKMGKKTLVIALSMSQKR